MRGQTTLDFLIGAAIFLLAVSVVMAMVPGMLDPFAVGDSSNSVEANRAAESLATDELSGTETPYVLEETAVDDFFALDEAGVKDRLRLHERTSINVTLENRTGRVYETGPELPDDGSITTTWRIVRYDGEQSTIRVRTW
ncbi:MAG: DUF7287 family protein [archaeon]